MGGRIPRFDTYVSKVAVNLRALLSLGSGLHYGARSVHRIIRLGNDEGNVEVHHLQAVAFNGNQSVAGCRLRGDATKVKYLLPDTNGSQGCCVRLPSWLGLNVRAADSRKIYNVAIELLQLNCCQSSRSPAKWHLPMGAIGQTELEHRPLLLTAALWQPSAPADENARKPTLPVASSKVPTARLYLY